MSIPPDPVEIVRSGWIRIRSYCTCGSKLDVSSSPPGRAEGVHELWRGLHSGDGHDSCDAATARRARHRSLDAVAAEIRPRRRVRG